MPDQFAHDDTGAEIDSVFEEVAATDVAFAPDTPAPGAADPGLDQVREILLGQQTRQIEQRLTASEQRVDRSIAELNSETTRRVEALESSIKGELGALIETLGAQREERTSQYRQLQEAVDRVAADVEAKIGELSTRLDALDEATRTEMTKQLAAVNEELETRALELSNEISVETAQLRGDLVEREAMATMFGELSARFAARPIDSDAAALDTGTESEAMIDELLGGEGV